MAKKDRGIDVLESSAIFHSGRELPKDYAKIPSQQANNEAFGEILGCNPINPPCSLLCAIWFHLLMTKNPQLGALFLCLHFPLLQSISGKRHKPHREHFGDLCFTF